MMLQKKSNPWARLKYAYVLPLAAITVAVFAHPEISQSFNEISSAKISHFALERSTNEVKNLPEANLFTESQNTFEVHNPEDTTVYVTVERMPEFPGGDAKLLKFIADRIKYPERAAKNKIEGRVPCSFVVEKDGSISNVKVNNPVDPDLDNEAMRVIRDLPKFKPGEDKGKVVRVKYSVPVRFFLSAPSPPIRVDKVEDKILTEPMTDPSDPTLYVTAENMPEFPEGDAGLLKYVADNIKYPENAAKNGIQGRVSCTLVVEKDGSVSNAKVTAPVDPDLDKEALRVIMALPKFKPGTIDGKTVRVLYTVPVRFRLPPRPTD